MNRKQKPIAVPVMPYTASNISVVFINPITVSHIIFAIMMMKLSMEILLKLTPCKSQIKPTPIQSNKLSEKLEMWEFISALITTISVKALIHRMIPDTVAINHKL